MILEVLRKNFRPEFINRIDDIVVFRPLEREHIRDIVDIQVRNLSKRLTEKSIVLNLDNSARELLADRGYDPVYGARPLKRVIQRLIIDPLAMQIISGTIHGDSVVSIVAEGDELRFDNVEAKAA